MLGLEKIVERNGYGSWGLMIEKEFVGWKWRGKRRDEFESVVEDKWIGFDEGWEKVNMMLRDGVWVIWIVMK